MLTGLGGISSQGAFREWLSSFMHFHSHTCRVGTKGTITKTTIGVKVVSPLLNCCFILVGAVARTSSTTKPCASTTSTMSFLNGPNSLGISTWAAPAEWPVTNYNTRAISMPSLKNQTPHVCTRGPSSTVCIIGRIRFLVLLIKSGGFLETACMFVSPRTPLVSSSVLVLSNITGTVIIVIYNKWSSSVTGH